MRISLLFAPLQTDVYSFAKLLGTSVPRCRIERLEDVLAACRRTRA